MTTQKPRWKKRADFSILTQSRDFIVDKLNEYRLRYLQVLFILSKMQYTKSELSSFLKTNELENWELHVDGKSTLKLVNSSYLDTMRDNEHLVLRMFTHPNDTRSRYKDETLTIRKIKGNIFIVENKDIDEKFKKYVEDSRYPSHIVEYVLNNFVKNKDSLTKQDENLISVVNSMRYSAKVKIQENGDAVVKWCNEIDFIPDLTLLREYIKLNQEFKPSKRQFKNKAA